MELFDENNNKKYTPEILMNAYENLNHHNEFNFPDGDSFFVKFYAQKNKINKLLIKDMFSDIYLIDSFAQAGINDYETNDYEIAGFHLFDNNTVVIEYWGIKVNAQFIVRLYREKNRWYCTHIGSKEYVHHVCVNNFTNGHQNFDKLNDR